MDRATLEALFGISAAPPSDAAPTLSGMMDASAAWAGDNPLDAIALAVSPVPIIGDAIGFGNDMRHYATDPDSRTLANYLLTVLGLVPGIPPALSIVKSARDIGARAHQASPVLEKLADGAGAYQNGTTAAEAIAYAPSR